MNVTKIQTNYVAEIQTPRHTPQISNVIGPKQINNAMVLRINDIYIQIVLWNCVKSTEMLFNSWMLMQWSSQT